ncbi:MAG: hypothetical protein WA890_06320 [Micromonospora sp.]
MSCGVLAVLSHGTARRLATAASRLVLTSFLITRNDMRTGSALLAFVLLLIVVSAGRRDRS